MAYALYDPESGYYMTRMPLGHSGDFITAPEISQLFGEMIGIWVLSLWNTLGKPGLIHVVELGPGRGTLMADVMRVARFFPDFYKALTVHLVEISPRLKAVQETVLSSIERPIHWHDSCNTLPPGVTIILANEFFDAFPICQYVRGARGWHERLVNCHETGALFFCADEEKTCALEHPYAHDHTLPEGTILEINEAAQEVVRYLSQHIKTHKGILLMVDYGASHSGYGDTLQGLYRHRFVSPLEHLGQSDLTAHVDFESLAKVSRCEGATVYGPVSQRDFLCSLGIQERAKQLQRCATNKQREDIQCGLDRLVARGPQGMGELFRVMAISSIPLGCIPGF
jgi:SAM-dependent MidA family methyltransferase